MEQVARAANLRKIAKLQAKIERKKLKQAHDADQPAPTKQSSVMQTNSPAVRQLPMAAAASAPDISVAPPRQVMASYRAAVSQPQLLVCQRQGRDQTHAAEEGAWTARECTRAAFERLRSEAPSLLFPKPRSRCNHVQQP